MPFVDVRVSVPFHLHLETRAGRISRWQALEHGEILEGTVDALLALSGMLDLTYDLMADVIDLGQLGAVSDAAAASGEN